MNYTEQELREAKRQIDSMLHKLRQTIKTFEAKENAHRYQSQITLAKRRTAAFEIASCLIEGELGRSSAPGRTVIIRKERKEDYAKIYSVVKRAFQQAEYKDGTEQDLINDLRDGDAYIPDLSLVAEAGGTVVGHIMFTKAMVGETEVLALAPLAVLPEYQRQGIGTALIREGHRIGRLLGYGYSVVLGSEKFYPRAGYLPADTFGITAPFDVPREHYMVCRLNESAAEIRGVVHYAKEFGLDVS